MKGRTWPAGLAMVCGALAGACERSPETTASPAERALERLPLELCRPEGVSEDLLCGRLEVPENRSAPNGARISLAVVVVPALAERPELEPWIDLEGGPGDSATELASMYAEELPEYRQSRDVVLIDQRGTGQSSPLSCEELDSPEAPLLPRFHLETVVRCRDLLSETRDLTAYSTSESVRDFDAVREWLGYERVRLFGYSYGTLAAVTYARLFPERVTALALWGPVPPSFQRPRYFARDGQRALDLHFEQCRRQPDCAAAFPDLEADLETALERLTVEPGTVDWRRADGSTVPVRVTRASFGEGLWSALFHQSAGVPRVLHAAARGDLVPFERLVNADGRFIARDATEAMYLSVTCAEETLRFALADRDEADAERLLGEGRLLRQVEACASWPSRVVPEEFFEPLESDVPTLVVVGELDPVTPTHWAHEMVSGLTRSRVVVVPAMAHSADGMENAECIDRLIASFGRQPAPDPLLLDTSCLDTMTPAPYALPE